ncbi:hypothetical protein DMN91_008577 [Ooceraea biroi]|uniref:GIY-YIG domain-containing protein n=1 Tax=Ooceraea biroi TaxID=2015173 RepID=A0A3L8DD17_OOCBI|nr:uncharacterized protein LOC105276310 [Ooceraea biroi]RLU18221.1 hypothetical protein DMN91_008577 [Ooceraea biroi]
MEFINRHIDRRLKTIRFRIDHGSRTNDGSVDNSRNFIVMPYVKGLSENVKRILNRCNVDFVYSVPKRLNNVIKLGKDVVANNQQMGVVYELSCVEYESVYIGQTKRHLETRVKEHKSNICKKDSCLSVVSKHRLENDHNFDWNNCKVLHRENHRRKREIAEMFFIMRQCNAINLQKDTDDLPPVYDTILGNM